MRMRSLLGTLILAISTCCLGAAPAVHTHGYYRVLPGEPGGKPPFDVVTFTYYPGPIGGEGVLWQLEVRAEDEADSPPLFQLRALTSGDPLADSDKPIEFVRYQLKIPETQETLEYRNVHTGKALLPAWGDFVHHFVPRPAKATRRQNGMPNTCEYLGHVLTLRHTNQKAEWPEWNDVKVLNLDHELSIGTSRNFKDRDGKRLPQEPERQNYPYVKFTADDYRVMIDAGINSFTITANQEAHVRSQPVFYLRGASGEPPLRYPSDLYRSNYIGNVMFMDEPTIIMIGDKNVHTVLRYFTDAAALITKRVRARYMSSGSYGGYRLERELRSRGVSFGDMRLAHVDYPSWETRYETAYYQLAGGLAGIVHEGRYRLDKFDEFVKASTGLDREHTAAEMLRYHYAFLRGAGRHFGKDWGTSIYGQANPELSPLAVKLAYDMGARYIWYWTSDHDHHLPWPEQLELTRIIRGHAAKHPRPSIRSPKPTLDKAIAIPYGYFLVLESPTTRKGHGDLWWVRELDAEGKNESSQRYRRLMRNAFIEIHKAFDAGEDFDITVDDGSEITGYRKVVRVNDE